MGNFYSDGKPMFPCRFCGKDASSGKGNYEYCSEHVPLERKRLYERDGEITNDADMVCPYCFEEIDHSWDFGLTRDEEEAEIDCPHCEKTFLATLNVKYSYTTTRSGEND
jgi:DNA-directed RNA polymerase subunit RPC12/RpoP